MKLEITNQGQKTITELLAGTEKLKFKELQLSDMDCSEIDVKNLTEISNIKQTTIISSVKIKNQNTVELLAAVDNAELIAGYYIKTIGVTATLEDGRTILFAIGIDNENPSYLPTKSEKANTGIDYKLMLAMDDTAIINVTIDPSAIPTISMLENKVDKKDGYGLSKNDYTDEEKLEVAKIKDQLVDLNNDQTIEGEKTFSKQIVANSGVQVTGDIQTTGGIQVTGDIQITGGIQVTDGDIQTTGDIRGNKVFNAVWNDLAEWFEKENVDDTFEAGDICSWHVLGVIPANKSIKNSFPIGVYSDSYGMILGGENRADMELNKDKYVPIGLAGRVSVKVKGEVDIGDLITISSDNGIGEKAKDDTPVNYIIGMALEKSSSNDVSKIKMLIK